jgi:hypothetical protein
MTSISNRFCNVPNVLPLYTQVCGPPARVGPAHDTRLEPYEGQAFIQAVYRRYSVVRSELDMPAD